MSKSFSLSTVLNLLELCFLITLLLFIFRRKLFLSASTENSICFVCIYTKFPAVKLDAIKIVKNESSKVLDFLILLVCFWWWIRWVESDLVRSDRSFCNSRWLLTLLSAPLWFSLIQRAKELLWASSFYRLCNDRSLKPASKTFYLRRTFYSWNKSHAVET